MKACGVVSTSCLAIKPEGADVAMYDHPVKGGWLDEALSDDLSWQS